MFQMLPTKYQMCSSYSIFLMVENILQDFSYNPGKYQPKHQQINSFLKFPNFLQTTKKVRKNENKKNQ
jgi:hypothetical protein